MGTNRGDLASFEARTRRREIATVVASAAAVALTLSSCSGGDGPASLRSVALEPDGRTLELEFVVCNPSHLEVRAREMPEEVVLAVSVGDGSEEDCAAIEHVVLDQPFADRRVVVEGAGEIDVHRLAPADP